MARLRDVPSVMRKPGPVAFCLRIWQQMNEDGIFVWASALAYSWLFAVFPFLIFLLSLVPYLPAHLRDSARASISSFTTSTLGNAAKVVNDNVAQVLSLPRHGWMGIGFIVSLWVSSGGMSMTMSALDQCYDIKRGRAFYIQRTLAMLLTIALIVMALAVIILLPVGAAVENWLIAHGMLSLPLRLGFDVARYALSLTFMFGVLAVIYHFGPNIKHRFAPMSPGAFFSVAVWILLDFAFRYYISKFAHYDQTYGAVGGVAILLFFFYIDALVLLIGAEINSEIDFQVLGVPEGTKDFRPAQGKSLVVEPASQPKLAEEL
ncbi:MAG: YihY/virulence factor BrkB family protein [Tepidisphaeraceae bacterium]|jgi:membrane protein